MRVLFLSKKSLIAAIKENTMLFLNYTVQKKNCENQKKDWQTVGYEQDFIDDKTCRNRPKNKWNAPA